MKTRTCLALSALLLAGASTGAQAASAKVLCNAVTDPAGDVGLYGATGPTPDSDLDVVSADLAGGVKGVTAVIRLTHLATPTSVPPGHLTSPLAAIYELRFTHHKSSDTYVLWVNVPQGAPATFGVGTVDESATAEMAVSTGTATGELDTTKNEIRISAPYAALGGAARGVKAGIEKVVAKRGVPGNYYGRYADSTDGARSQVLGTKTCVKTA